MAVAEAEAAAALRGSGAGAGAESAKDEGGGARVLVGVEEDLGVEARRRGGRQRQ